MDDLAPEDILVLVCHPHMDLWMPLRDWLPKRPGGKARLRPIAAKHAQTGAPLPLTAIPLAVRNDPESWEAVRLGWLQDPEWPNEHYGAQIQQVNVEEGTLCVMVRGQTRTVLISEDTEIVLLDNFEFRRLKDHLKDDHVRAGADVILMTRRKNDQEIAFQLQLISSAKVSLPANETVESVPAAS